MIILDTDHFTIAIDRWRTGHEALAERMTTSADPSFASSIITVEEQLRGWLASIRSRIDLEKQVEAYRKLQEYLEVLKPWHLLPFDAAAAAMFRQLRSAKVRVGSEDLKIASIALVNDALLLSANLRDFRRVPGLRVESWIG